MKKIMEQLKYWGQVLMIPLYLASFLTPRNKNIWLFGSSFGYSFQGNPKYLYLYMNQFQKDSIRSIWISKDKNIVDLLRDNGYKAYWIKSIKGMYYCLRGSIYIFDNYSKDISFWLSGGAKKVNLWHGVPIKKISHDNNFDKVRHPKNTYEKFKTYLRRMSDEKPHHYTLATSEFIADVFTSAFKTTKNHILICGYPRNDVLFDNSRLNIHSKKEKKYINSITECIELGKKVVLYTPTFRDSEEMFFKIMDLSIFNNYLESENIMFYVKLHPKSKLKEKFSEISFTSIMNIEPGIDIYTFLKFTDILITDYSSIYFDFLMCNKPIIFFPYDYEVFLRETREFYFDYDKYTPGIKVYNMDELIKCISDTLVSDVYKNEREVIRDKMFDYIDDLSGERVCEIIKKLNH